MSHLYLTDVDFGLLWVMLALIFAAMGGFLAGFVLADNRHKADDAYNPRLRPDRHHENRS